MSDRFSIEALYSILSRQDTEAILSETTPLTLGDRRTSRTFRVDGQSIIRIAGASDGDFEVFVEESNDCDGGVFREVARFISIPDAPGTGEFISVRYAPSGDFVRFTELSPPLGTPQTTYRLVIKAQPVGCCEGGGWAGLGSPQGPGERVVTKADLAVGAAVSTNVIVAADIPAGSRRVTIKNVGANPIRIKADGEGGGAGRGLEVAAGQTMSIGTRGGALAALDGFSTLGTTLAFFFERD